VAGGAVLFAELRSPEVRASDGASVALLPVGAVEPHGPHAPLGTDTIISEAVCRRAAAELSHEPALRVLVLPSLAYGVTRFSRDFPGSLSIAPQTLRSLVHDICSALRDQGMTHRVVVNSHFEPEHVAALRDAVGATGSVLFDVTRRRLAERLTEEFRSGAAHAGCYETSLVLALRPELVDTASAARLPDHFVDMPAEMARGKDSFIAMGMDHAYCGSPSRATANEGEQTLTTLATMLVELVRERVSL
jgi:creatinine amidohydrolase